MCATDGEVSNSLCLGMGEEFVRLALAGLERTYERRERLCFRLGFCQMKDTWSILLDVQQSEEFGFV